MIRIRILDESKDVKVKDVLIDEQTRGECEKINGDLCYLLPKSDEKPKPKTVKSEHLSGINFRSREEVKKANEKYLNDWMASCNSPDEYDAVSNYILGLSKEQYLVMVYQPNFMRKIFGEVLE